MRPTDYVANACIADSKDCSLCNKCEECKKEIKSLEEIDKMFATLFYTLSGADSPLTSE